MNLTKEVGNRNGKQAQFLGNDQRLQAFVQIGGCERQVVTFVRVREVGGDILDQGGVR